MSESGLEGWGEYKKLILKELERLEIAVNDLNRRLDTFRADDVASLRADIASLRVEMASIQMELKLKAGIWGLIGSAIPTVGALLWYLLSK